MSDKVDQPMLCEDAVARHHANDDVTSFSLDRCDDGRWRLSVYPLGPAPRLVYRLEGDRMVLEVDHAD